MGVSHNRQVDRTLGIKARFKKLMKRLHPWHRTYSTRVFLACICCILWGQSIPYVRAGEPQDSSAPSQQGRGRIVSEVDIEIDGGDRVITSNGIPASSYGTFPNADNPYTIAPQRHEFRVPLKPTLAETPTPVEFAAFGVAIDGVPFDPGTAEYWNGDRRSGWHYEALLGARNLGIDKNHAHVQPHGAYHYHGLPTGLVEQLGASRSMRLIGYAADGFPIYGPYGYVDTSARSLRELTSSYALKSGQRPHDPGGSYDGTFVQDYEYSDGAGDLDECNGRAGVTPDSPTPTYHYVITTAFPFVPRCWRGLPDESFRHRPLTDARGAVPPLPSSQPPSRHPARMGPPPSDRPFPPPGRPPGPPPNRVR